MTAWFELIGLPPSFMDTKKKGAIIRLEVFDENEEKALHNRPIADPTTFEVRTNEKAPISPEEIPALLSLVAGA